jgi:hypothetical protein
MHRIGIGDSIALRPTEVKARVVARRPRQTRTKDRRAGGPSVVVVEDLYKTAVFERAAIIVYLNMIWTLIVI